MRERGGNSFIFLEMLKVTMRPGAFNFDFSDLLLVFINTINLCGEKKAGNDVKISIFA